jgi:hypothetical protein
MRAKGREKHRPLFIFTSVLEQRPVGKREAPVGRRGRRIPAKIKAEFPPVLRVKSSPLSQ